MYVCVCRGITDKQIRQRIEHGCCSMRQLREELGVVTQCGKCAPAIQEILKDTLTYHPIQPVKTAA